MIYPSQHRFSLLLSPVFLTSLGVLIINDLYLKFTFPSWVTGKLSDIAGIIAFALFFQVLFFSHRKFICVFIALAFIFWKSIYANSFVYFINNSFSLHLHRVVDYTDLIGLIGIPFTYIYIDRFSYQTYSIKPFFIYIISFVSITSFIATSQKKHDYYILHQEYELPFSKEVFIEKINALKNNCNNPVFSFNFSSKYKKPIVFYSDTEWVHIAGYHTYADTIYTWDSSSHFKKIDTIYKKEIPIVDTFYIPPSTDFLYRFRLRNTKNEEICECAMADLVFIKRKNKTILKVIGIGACTSILYDRPNGTEKKGYMLDLFEKEVLDKIY